MRNRIAFLAADRLCQERKRLVYVGFLLSCCGLMAGAGEFLVFKENFFDRQSNQTCTCAGGPEAVAGISPGAVGA